MAFGTLGSGFKGFGVWGPGFGCRLLDVAFRDGRLRFFVCPGLVDLLGAFALLEGFRSCGLGLVQAVSRKAANPKTPRVRLHF